MAHHRAVGQGLQTEHSSGGQCSGEDVTVEQFDAVFCCVVGGENASVEA